MKAILKPFVVMLGIIIGTAAADTAFAADTVATGGFSNVAMKTKGTWTLETRADGVYAVLSEDFKARKAPDLKIFLHTAAAGSVDDDNAGEGLFIAELTSHKGAQEYKLPEGLDLSAYKSFVIHCERYSKFWAAGNIN
ncbi:MAG: DM13 domain-containing protein [Kordiimonadaceae bacterium]|nr:DM13 domain-containing protein [Kordiimonadaceae bacterium]MBO6569545.1 DM13 domain-containing protein [Kordiimonadaceae bacterium]MBO6965020.1 DM13 domain-containing protein [Kordiimonadaceae bacterium]